VFISSHIASWLRAPNARLAVSMPLGLAVIAITLLMALRLPWSGLVLQWDPDLSAARVLSASGPSAHVPAGTAVVAIGDGNRRFPLNEIDLTIEPDGNLPSHSEYRRFLSRQGELASIQFARQIELITASGQSYHVTPQAWRPPLSLPVDFWVQLIVGLFAWLIVASVWAFRPDDLAVRYLLLNGLATLLFSPGAAVYTTRELAVPLEWLLLLKTMNFGGGLLYCGTMTSLLWVYPRRLGPRWVATAIVTAYIAWFFIQATGVIESMMLARRWPVFIAVAATIVLGVAQWRGTRRDPVARAALQWFLLSWLVGIGLLVLLTMVPQLYGVNTAALQGYSFALMLLVYGGIAFGVLRFRLFELGEWWFRALTWITGALMLVGMDLLLMMTLHLTHATSLTLSLLICGLVWLPLRGWLWMRLVSRRQADTQELFKGVLRVALAPTREQHRTAWVELLQQSYAPLRIEPLQTGPAEPTPANDGAALLIPATAQAPALQLEYPRSGRSLFTPKDVALCERLLDVLRYAEDRRDAYAEGARDERSRIARDLHDDIGSLLLTGLHQPGIEQTRASIAQAMSEMRSIIGGLTGQRMSLDAAIAEIRYEIGDRLELAGIKLNWPVDISGGDCAPCQDLEYPVYKNLVSVMRELSANVIRHAQATHVSVLMERNDDELICSIEDDGVGFDGQTRSGNGVGNLRRRLAEIGGRICYQKLPRGTRVEVRFRLSPRAIAAS